MKTLDAEIIVRRRLIEVLEMDGLCPSRRFRIRCYLMGFLHGLKGLSDVDEFHKNIETMIGEKCSPSND